MNFENFTIKAQEAVQQAATIATSRGQQIIETGHILKSVLETDEILPVSLLKSWALIKTY